MLRLTVRDELPDLVVSAWLVAVIVTFAGFGTLEGAVYNPELEMVPTVLLPPAILFTDQFTVWLGLFVPLTAALH